MTVPDWDDAFANSAYIADAASYPPRWSALAQAFRATATGRFDQAYGAAPRARYDLFLPAGTPKGVLVFVHGGYWKAFDRSDWSHLAAGAVARGWAVALPGYTLAPDARIDQMTTQIARAITTLAAEVAGPIHLAGHSAGGHLVTRMLCAPTPLPDDVLARVGHVTSISGVHDLRPLVQTRMNDTLGLTPDIAQAESPALQARVSGPAVTAWVGAQERPEFLRQARLLAQAWPGTTLVIDPGRHHFDVIDGLQDPDSALLDEVLRAPPKQAIPGG